MKKLFVLMFCFGAFLFCTPKADAGRLSDLIALQDEFFREVLTNREFNKYRSSLDTLGLIEDRSIASPWGSAHRPGAFAIFRYIESYCSMCSSLNNVSIRRYVPSVDDTTARTANTIVYEAIRQELIVSTCGDRLVGLCSHLIFEFQDLFGKNVTIDVDNRDNVIYSVS